MADKLIPDINECIGDAITALVAERPDALKHINGGKGRWSHLFEGWKAQGNIVARRFASEAKATRLFDEGVPLQQLAASEYDTILANEPTVSVGEFTATRVAGTYPAGVIRKGHLILKQGDPTKQPIPVESARYEVERDVLVAKNQTTVVVPIKATRTGPSGNIPRYITSGLTDTYSLLKFSTPPFDTNLTIQDSISAGGTMTPNADPILRRAAAAASQGKFGPTEGAILAGALLYSGIANLAIIDNYISARTMIFPVDESWAYSDSLNSSLGQFVKDNSAGFGCAIKMGKVTNQFIHIDATVKLFDGRYLLDTSTILEDIKTSLKFYFDERPDWWLWNEEAVRSTIVSANRKIYSCSNLVITDAISSSVLTSPSFVMEDLEEIPLLLHYYLSDNAVNIEFEGP